MEGELRDCPWCGLPLELKKLWTRVYPRALGDEGPSPERQMAVAACLNDHWYSGPAEDVLA